MKNVFEEIKEWIVDVYPDGKENNLWAQLVDVAPENVPAVVKALRASEKTATETHEAGRY